MITIVQLVLKSASVFAAIAVALLLCANGRASAQPNIDPRAAGTTYVFTFPDTTSNQYDARQDTDPRFRKREPLNDSISVAIYSAVDNEIAITGYGGYSKKLTMKASDFETIYLNDTPRASAPIVTESGVVTGKTFRIEATNPVVVYCFMMTKFGAEAFTPAPVASWGKSYYAAMLHGEVLYDEIPGGENNYDKRAKAGPSEILVMAAYDDTHVTIVPAARLDKNPPTSVLLRAGQCYQVQSYVDTNSLDVGNPQPDLGGSYIYADKPIGVISGNTRSQVIDKNEGLARNSFKNMMVEWLSPTDQHGRTFVYAPTADDWRPTGAPGEDPAAKRQGEVVRVYATSGSPDDLPSTITNVDDVEGLGGSLLGSTKIARGKFYETVIGTPNPHVFTTDRPAQAFMCAAAAVEFDGTTGGGNFVGATYSGIATYMVELIPVERWTYAAPFIAPAHPPKMSHYLNIVTDSSSRNRITINGQTVLINHPIAGTRYYWGTRTLNRGEKGMIRGADTNVRFFATIYGGVTGIETYRPGKTRKEGDGSQTGALHPSEYEENIGLMYGYPLAAAHVVLPSDSVEIVSSMACGTLRVRIAMLSADSVGLQSITLEPANNARLTFITPKSSADLLGRTGAEVIVTPIDSSRAASGMVKIQDRSGKSWQVNYDYTPLSPIVSPGDPLDFGPVDVGSRASKLLTLGNPSTNQLSITRVRLLNGTPCFTIDSTQPTLPATLAPGESLKIYVSFSPMLQDPPCADDIGIDYECGSLRVGLRGGTARPCISMNDLDFGTLKSGTFAVMPLKICNEGRGTVTFQSPLVTGMTRAFQISAADLDLLGKSQLGPDECITLAVLFHAEREERYQTTARFWANTRECKDTSVWSALALSNILGVEGSETVEGYSLGAIEPNPFSASTAIAFTLGASGRTSVEIFDATGARIVSLADTMLDAGRHALGWDAGDLPSGIYYCGIHSGSWSITRPLLLVR